jgi:hypothetical protein
VWGALGAMAGLLGGTWAGSAAGLSLGFSSSAGGGGSCSGGMFNLNCAVGQADAGVCTGSSYLQQGGFVPGFIKTLGPPLTMTRAGNQFTFTWPNICTGFVLEASPTVDGPGWRGLGSGTVDGASRKQTVFVAGAPAFFRLRKDCPANCANNCQ